MWLDIACMLVALICIAGSCSKELREPLLEKFSKSRAKTK